MSEKLNTEKLYKELLEQFKKDYDLDSLNNSNDATNLDIFLRNHVLIKLYTARIDTLMQADDPDIKQITQYSTARDETTKNNLSLERQLGIDRKTRKKDNETSAAEYIMHLKLAAREYLDQRLIKVYCPNCNVMVMRFSPVHDHTAFKIGVQCSQCNKLVRAERKERDIFYDLVPNDRAWRKAHPVEIKHAKIPDSQNVLAIATSDIEPDVMIGDGDHA